MEAGTPQASGITRVPTYCAEPGQLKTELPQVVRSFAIQPRMVARASSSEMRGPQNIGAIAACAALSASSRGPEARAKAGSTALGITAIYF